MRFSELRTKNAQTSIAIPYRDSPSFIPLKDTRQKANIKAKIVLNKAVLDLVRSKITIDVNKVVRYSQEDGNNRSIEMDANTSTAASFPVALSSAIPEKRYQATNGLNVCNLSSLSKPRIKYENCAKTYQRRMSLPPSLFTAPAAART